jgi:hypothetical protein
MLCPYSQPHGQGVYPLTCHYYFTNPHQSILSQFSHETKATDDASEDAEDAAALDELDDELGEDNGTENEEHVGLEDELEVLVAQSDTAMLDEVAAEVGGRLDLPVLTRAEVNLGKFAVTKVSIIIMILNDTNVYIILPLTTSYKTLPNRCSTVPQSV